MFVGLSKKDIYWAFINAFGMILVVYILYMGISLFNYY